MNYSARTTQFAGRGLIMGGTASLVAGYTSLGCVRWAILLGWVLGGFAALAHASDGMLGGTYDDAIKLIPFDKMTDDAQGKLWRIVSQPSLYRRLPVTRMQADPDMYLFLIRHPEVVVNMWDLMGVTKVQIRRNGNYT
ncbi:MAG: hypothetical protein AB7F89_25595, partial [Pirellulaceae bacterium]